VRALLTLLAAVVAAAAPLAVIAGAQQYEPLSASVRAAMSRAVSDKGVPHLRFKDPEDGYRWLLAMSDRLAKRVPDAKYRVELLKTVHYEATRAGLDPQLVLGIIFVESGFKKYAVSKAGARGLMQVMPFWVGLIGEGEHNLFHLRTNIRYGCVILRHYLDIEKGDLYRALGRYNGSLGKPEYPTLVLAAWRGTFKYPGPLA
jgi:soluble lytic murein transglycosylase-like protein